MDKTDKELTLIYVVSLIIAGGTAVFFEFIAPDFMGILFDEQDRTMRTVLESISIISCLAGVYGALKLLSIPKVAHECTCEDGYWKWALVRWMLVFCPMTICLLTYYLFMSTNVVAFLGIGLICLLFVWPTSSRRMKEMGFFNDEYKEHDA